MAPPGRDASSARGGLGLVAFRETRYGWIVLLCVWLAAGLYTGLRLTNRTFTNDMGTLGQAAERILQGQVPCRDFHCAYTGGLDYLNAFSFRLLGVNALSLRIPLFLFFLAWIPAVYFIARRFTGPLGAASATFLAVVWSVPNYPEGAPSWYLLFFATWGALALLRYTEAPRSRWLWLAGACGGLAFLVKTPALYFVAGSLLFLAFHETFRNRASDSDATPGSRAYRIFAVGCLAVFAYAVVSLIAQRPWPKDFFQFALPSVSLAVFVAWTISRQRQGASGPRFRRLLGMVLPFLGGFAIPVASWGLFLLRVGALRDWFEQTFVTSAGYIQWIAQNPIGLAAIIGLVPLALVVLAAWQRKSPARPLIWLAWLAGAVVALAATRFSLTAYVMLGTSLPLVVPLIALATPLCLRARPPLSELRRQQALLVVAIAVLCALVQFPASTVLYFYHVAPLEILAILALVSLRAAPSGPEAAVLVCFYLGFAIWLHPPAYFAGTPAYRPGHSVPLRTLAISRATDIRVPPEQAAVLDELIRAVDQHARGPYIYAGPNLPEIYFLSARRNPTRTLLDFLTPDFFDPVGRSDRILRAIDDHGVTVVVTSIGPGGIPATLHAGLDARFPHFEDIGPFQVRWKNKPEPRSESGPGTEPSGLTQ